MPRFNAQSHEVTVVDALFHLNRRARLICAFALLLILELTFAVNTADAQGGKIAPISAELCIDMKSRNVMTPISPLSCTRLRLVTFPYVGFDDRVHSDGEIVVMDAVAEHVLAIFDKLRGMRFPIAKARLMNHYNGNDSASTADNNTSSFNARKSVGGSSLSMHAYGLAIDLNPVQNPYVTRSGSTLRVARQHAAGYVNRSLPRPGMAESVIDVFADHGFLVWGGDWHNPIDYQHFQASRGMAERLAVLPADQAQAVFKRYVERYRACRGKSGQDTSRLRCTE